MPRAPMPHLQELLKLAQLARTLVFSWATFSRRPFCKPHSQGLGQLHIRSLSKQNTGHGTQGWGVCLGEGRAGVGLEREAVSLLRTARETVSDDGEFVDMGEYTEHQRATLRVYGFPEKYQATYLKCDKKYKQI